MSLNLVFLAGALATEPKALLNAAQETVGVQFRILTKEQFKDENSPSGFREVESSSLVRVMDPDAAPEILELPAGEFMCVRGFFYPKEWEENGEKKRTWYVLADEWGPTLNYCILKGNLGADPELSEMGNTGRHKARFRLATNRRVPDEAKPGEYKDESCWLTAQCFFQGLAKMLADKFHKGDEIVLHGRYQEEPYEDKETKQLRQNTYLKVLGFDWGKRKGAGGNGSNVDGQPPGFGGNDEMNQMYAQIPDLDDEIPF